MGWAQLAVIGLVFLCIAEGIVEFAKDPRIHPATTTGVAAAVIGGFFALLYLAGIFS